MREVWKLIVLFITLFISQIAFSHSVQFAYCTSCDGAVRIWVEHWHGNENPSGTTMTLEVTVAGVTTSHTGIPNTSALNTPIADLDCASTITVFGGCPGGEANKYNDWVAYDFTSLPTDASIEIVIISGNTVFTEEGCPGLFPLSTGIIVIPPPPNYVHTTECKDENGMVGPIPASANTTWTNDNPGIGLPAGGVGEIPAFIPTPSATVQVANLTVSNSCGFSPFTLTIHPSPSADIDLQASSSSPICLGETMSFMDDSSPAQGSGINNFLWDFGDGSPPQGGTTPSHVYTQAGQYQVVLTVTDANTCTDDFVLPVKVMATPAPNFNATSVCENATTAFTNNTTIIPVDGDVITGYTWDFGNANSSTVENPTEAFGTENVYDVELTATSNFGCVGRITKPVEVYPMPVAGFSATKECLNFATQFTDGSSVSNAHTGNTIVAWNWDYTGGNNGVGQNPTHTYLAPGDYDVELIVTTNNNCVDSKTVSVTVDELPVATFDFTNACDNENILLASTSTANAPGNLDYSWDVDNDNVTDYSTDSPSHVFNQDGFHDVKLIVENSNGCIDEIVKEITVYALPNTDFTSDAVCEDATTSFTNSSTIVPVDNDVINDYKWDFGNGNSSALENPTEGFNTENIYQTKLVITTNYGCKDSITKSVEVYPLPIPSFSASKECLKFATQFTDGSTVSSVNTANTNVAWNWDYTDGSSGSTQNPSHTYLAPGDYDVELTVTTNNDCVASKIVSVTVDELPVSNYDFTNACDNENVMFGSTSTVNAPGNLNYFWDVDSDDITDYSINPIEHVFDQDGFHDVRLIVENSNGCRDTIVKEITVYALPITDFTATSVCEDATTSFTNISTIHQYDNDVIDDYKWDFGNGNSSLIENPTEDFVTENIYQAKLVITTNFGCKDSITKPVEVYPLPAPDFTATRECLHFPTQFTDISTVSNDHTTNTNVAWDWDYTDGDFGSVQNPSHTYLAPGDYSVELTVTTDKGCIKSENVTITVDELPVASFDFTNACDNQEILVEDTSIPNAASISIYDWYIEDDQYSTSVASHVYEFDGFHDIMLIVENSNGCRDTIVQEVTVYALPSTDFSFDEVCEDATTSFTNNSSILPVINDVIVEYEWNFGNGTTSALENPTVDFGSENIYETQLIVTSNFGCKDTASIFVEVYPLPEVDYTATSECFGFATDFSNLSSISTDYTINTNESWEWDFDDGNVESAFNTSHTYAAPGIYNTELTVTSDKGCVSSFVVPVTVYEVPVASFDFTNACDNEDVVLESTTTANAPGNTNYFWDINSDDVHDYFTGLTYHTFSHNGFHDVRLIVENSNGCRDTIVQEITVYALPSARYTVDAVCEDAITTFTNNSFIVPVQNDVIAQYDWDFGNGTSSNAENPTVDYGAENMYEAQLNVTTNHGCKDSIVLPVSVYPLPVVDFSPTDVCLEFPTHFGDESTVSNLNTSNSIVAWDWDFADGNTSNDQNPLHTYMADGVYNSVLTVTTNNNCTAKKTIVLTVHPKPSASFVGVDLEGCAPVCPSVNSLSTINNPSTLDHYKWELSDGTIYEGSNPSFTDCFDIKGGEDHYYDVLLTVTSNMGCIDQHLESDFISVYHNPIADYYITPDAPNILDPVVDFHNTSLYADFYKWTIDFYGETSESDPFVEFPADSATYTSTLIAYTDKGCSDTITEDIKILDKLIFYIPNTFTPDGNTFNEIFKPVFTSGFDPQTYSLYIFNRWGEVVFESHDTDFGWDGTYGVNRTETVSDGVYIWKLDFRMSVNDEQKSYSGNINVFR